MTASSRANASIWRRRSGVSREERQQARPRDFPACRPPGGIPAPRSRPAPGWPGSPTDLDHAAADRPPRASDTCRPRPSARRRAPVRASRCRTSRAPPARSGTPPASPPSRPRCAAAPAIAPSPARSDVDADAGRSAPRPRAVRRVADSADASRQRPPAAAGSRRSGFPAAPAAPAARQAGGAPPRRSGASSRDFVRQRMADIGAGRPAEPRVHLAARTAAAPAHDRYRRASRAPGPAATPRPKARHIRRSGSRDRPRAPAGRRRWVKSGTVDDHQHVRAARATTASAVSRMSDAGSSESAAGSR